MTRPDEALSWFERAFRQFKRAADAMGMACTCCGAMEAILLDWKEFGRLDRWIVALDRLFDPWSRTAPAGLARLDRWGPEVRAVIRDAFLRGLSPRVVERVVALLTEEPVSAQTVSRVTPDLDQAVAQFHQAPLTDDWRYLFLEGVACGGDGPAAGPCGDEGGCPGDLSGSESLGSGGAGAGLHAPRANGRTRIRSGSPGCSGICRRCWRASPVRGRSGGSCAPPM